MLYTSFTHQLINKYTAARPCLPVYHFSTVPPMTPAPCCPSSCRLSVILSHLIPTSTNENGLTPVNIPLSALSPPTGHSFTYTLYTDHLLCARLCTCHCIYRQAATTVNTTVMVPAHRPHLLPGGPSPLELSFISISLTQLGNR